MRQVEPTILLVEDSEGDVFIMRHALKQAGVTNPLQIVTAGQRALDYHCRADGDAIDVVFSFEPEIVHGIRLAAMVTAAPKT